MSSERLPNLTYHPSNTILHSLRALCAMRVDIANGMPVRDAAEMRAAVYQCDAAALVTAWVAIAGIRLEEIEAAPAPRGWDCVEGDDEPDYVSMVNGWIQQR